LCDVEVLSNQKIRTKRELKMPVPILQIDDMAVNTKAEGAQEVWFNGWLSHPVGYMLAPGRKLINLTIKINRNC